MSDKALDRLVRPDIAALLATPLVIETRKVSRQPDFALAKTTRPRITAEQLLVRDDKMWTLWKTGMTQAKIAQRFDLSDVVVSNAIRRCKDRKSTR